MAKNNLRASAGYRPEIDGLRALAVVPVILFHAGFSQFRGGYLGVDVFFVVSGYLITSILLRDLQSNQYSIAKFYERRARRILPALLLVIAASIPFAVAFMLPVELEQFSFSVLSALGFAPNVYFWLNSSYFHSTAELLPLLHTWSLGVEEQFYFVFPLFLVVVWKFRPRVVPILILLVGLVSLGLAEWAWRTDRAAAGFFLAPTRAWELMIGCFIASASLASAPHAQVHRLVADLFAATGLVALIVSFAIFDESTPMPSLRGLIPTIGTGLVIAYARPGSIVFRLLSLSPLVRLGLISYSAYLWHQPLFAFARLSSGVELSFTQCAMLIAVTLVLAHLSWRFIETPFRDRNRVSGARLWRTSILGVGVVASLASAGVLTHGLKARLSKDDQGLAAMADSVAAGRHVPDRFHALNREFSSSSVPKFLVVGDSYAQDFINATFESGWSRDAEFRTGYISWDCQIYLGSAPVDAFIEPRFRPKCVKEHAALDIRRRVPRADAIILVGAWRSWAIDRLPETIAALGLRAGQRVIVVGRKNFGDINIRRLLSIEPSLRPSIRQQPTGEVLQLNRQLRAVVGSDMFVDMQTAACGLATTCPIFTPEGELISFDGAHLTQAGARWLGALVWSSDPLVGLLPSHQ